MLSEKPVPVITGRQPTTLHVFVYIACIFASISVLLAYVLVFRGVMYGLFVNTPQQKESVFCSCKDDNGVRQFRTGHRIMLCRKCSGLKEDGAILR